MKSPKSLRQETYKKTLSDLVAKFPEARKVKNRYDVMKAVLRKEWNNTLTTLKENGVNIDNFLKDVVYVDRMIRKSTSGYDTENKKIESQKFQLNELNAELHDNLSKNFIRDI